MTEALVLAGDLEEEVLRVAERATQIPGDLRDAPFGDGRGKSV